ncbi:UNVERIFIED_CONTAM: hypothetical protein GTU68_061174 [Idotea baltica]|nr:hypothetical protein [Idotea baltica]
MSNQEQIADLSRVLVVTGSIASGKTSVTALLKALGATTISADDLARREVEPNSNSLREIVSEFGQEVLNEDGSLNRMALADIVFSSKKALSKLESILHPHIQAQCDQLIAEAQANGASLVVYDCPLYFEAGLEAKGFGAVLLVSVDPKIALNRATKRDQLSASDIEKKQKSQLADGEKRKGAEFIIENNGSLEDLEKKVSELAPKLFEIGTKN